MRRLLELPDLVLNSSAGWSEGSLGLKQEVVNSKHQIMDVDLGLLPDLNLVLG